MHNIQISRRNFLKGSAALAGFAALAAMTGCSSSGEASADSGSGDSAASSDPITMVWLPDNSSADLSAAREAMGAAITAASGREVELMTTTDYNVAIEAIVAGNAQMAYLGAEGYTQAHEKNPAVVCAFTQSDEEGGLDGACYYSRICVRKEDAEQYKDGDGYSIANIKGKAFSFVTATSASGFAIPSAAIVSEFGLESSDELLEGGAFFSEVLFGNSHAGSMVNLLAGDCDAAAFDDVDVDMYLELVEGEANAVGAVYRAREDAEAPVDTVAGKEFVIIQATPVLNGPFCFNTEAIDEETRTKITEYFCSDAVADDPQIFVDPEDENASGIFTKDSEEMGFVQVEDSWYDPIRNV